MQKVPEEWKQFQKWNWQGMTALIAIPILVITSINSKGTQFEALFQTLIYGFAPLLIFTVYCLLRQHYFKCPRCSQYFYINPTLSKARPVHTCAHCGLKLYENPGQSD